MKEDAYHPAFNIVVCQQSLKEQQNCEINTEAKDYNFRKANLIALYDEMLSADWSILNSTTDINVAIDRF